MLKRTVITHGLYLLKLPSFPQQLNRKKMNESVETQKIGIIFERNAYAKSIAGAGGNGVN